MELIPVWAPPTLGPEIVIVPETDPASSDWESVMLLPPTKTRRGPVPEAMPVEPTGFPPSETPNRTVPSGWTVWTGTSMITDWFTPDLMVTEFGPVKTTFPEVYVASDAWMEEMPVGRFGAEMVSVADWPFVDCD